MENPHSMRCAMRAAHLNWPQSPAGNPSERRTCAKMRQQGAMPSVARIGRLILAPGFCTRSMDALHAQRRRAAITARATHVVALGIGNLHAMKGRAGSAPQISG